MERQQSFSGAKGRIQLDKLDYRYGYAHELDQQFHKYRQRRTELGAEPEDDPEDDL